MKVYTLYEGFYNEKITHGVFSSIDKVIDFIKDREEPLFKTEDITTIQNTCINTKLKDIWFYIEINEVDNTNYDACQEEVDEIEKRFKKEFN